MEEADANDNRTKVTNVEAKIAKLKERKIDYELLERKLQESDDTQISTTDPDARAVSYTHLDVYKRQVLALALND